MNRLVTRIHDEQLRELASLHLAGVIIDIGCGIKPYADLLAPFVDRHVGFDHPGSPHDPSEVDVAGVAYGLPFRDASFDGALCTMVLEHLEEPAQALSECARTLRPGGKLLISVPFIWHLHEEPRDFYRYTRHGLRYLLEKVGLEVVELRALSGYWVTTGQLLAYYVSTFDRGIIRRLRLMVPVYLAIQGCAGVLDRLHRAEGWTWAYMAVAERPDGTAV